MCLKILIVDDEELIRTVIKEYSIDAGFNVDEASSGVEALEKIMNNNFDILILDIMMPKMDGYTLLEEIPEEKRIPTIVLSARGEEFDKLKGFDLGIDDYVTKPFSPKELIARINAVLSRSGKKKNKIYKYKDLELNHSAHTLKIDSKIINITPKEYEILTYLINNKGIAISREQLLSNIWGYDFFGEDRTVDTHIKMLRNSLGKYRDNIVTIRGLGYKYEENDSK